MAGALTDTHSDAFTTGGEVYAVDEFDVLPPTYVVFLQSLRGLAADGNARMPINIKYPIVLDLEGPWAPLEENFFDLIN